MNLPSLTALARRLHHHYSQPGADVSRIVIDLGQIVEGLEYLAGRMIAPGHNPDRLTVEQVGDGWRLLEVGEIEDATDQFWPKWKPEWLPNAGWGVRVVKDRSQYCIRRRIEPSA